MGTSDQDAEPPGEQPRGRRAPYNWQQRRALRSDRSDDLTAEQRRARDRSRLLDMQLEGFGGPTWELVAEDTWSYLLDVLPGMIRKGSLLTRRKKLIRLRNRSWAVNTAAWKLAAPLKRLIRERRWTTEPKLSPEPTPDEFDRPESIIHVVDFERRLSAVPKEVHRVMIRFKLDGLTEEAIAIVTHRSLKQVEYGVRKARRVLRAERDRETLRENLREFRTNGA